MNFFVAVIVLSVAIAPALLWPDLLSNHILVDPNRIEDLSEMAKLTTHVNEAARTGQFFEQTIELDWANYYVKRSRKDTDGAVRPYHFHRFEMANGQFRVMCRAMPNWIHESADNEWHQAIHNVTNLFAFTLTTHPKGDTNDIVCEFLTAADDREAACLLILRQYSITPFPEPEFVAREHHHQKADKSFDASEEHTELVHTHHKHLLGGKYCTTVGLYIAGIIFSGVLTLLALAAFGYFVFWLVSERRYTLLYWRVRRQRQRGRAILSQSGEEIELGDLQRHHRNSRSIESLTGDEMDEL